MTVRRFDSAVHQLPTLLRGEPDGFSRRVATLDARAWTPLAALAVRFGTGPLLWHRLQERGLEAAVPQPSRDVLKAAARRSTVRYLKHLGATAEIARVLAERRIPLIVLKGLHLAVTVYPQPWLRPMQDVDVLVPIERVRDAIMAVSALGYGPPLPDSFAIDPHAVDGLHGAPQEKPGVATFEVHWRLTRFGPPEGSGLDDVWKRTESFPVAGVRVLGLSPEDLLLHICGHLALQHGFQQGLRPCCDIAAIIDRHGARMNWPALAVRAREWRCVRSASLALSLAAELVGAAVPADVLEALRAGPDASRIRALARAQLLAPDSPVSAAVAEFATARRLSAKVRVLWRRCFVPRAEIGARYLVPPDLPIGTLTKYRLRRLWSAVRRHQASFRAWFGDSAARAVLVRRAALAEWLHEERGRIGD